MTSSGSAANESGRIARSLHPIAWWVWAIGMAIAVSRTTNPLLLGLALAVLAAVVANRRSDAPWARAFKYYLVFGVVIIAMRVVFRAVFATGVAPTDHVLFHLPHVPTPHWYSGVRLGGPVSLEAMLAAAVDGLRLATLICCVGAANALANPKRALRILPGALYELGVAIVVAISVAPQLVESVQRVARARRLRGGRSAGRHALRSIVIPVLEDALERSLLLARAMDSRGYGRSGAASGRGRKVTAALMLAGLLGLCAGIYGLLDTTTPRFLGFPAILGGSVLCCVGLAMGGRRVTRTHYRPDPWLLAEWIVAGCGVLAAVVLVVSSSHNAVPLNPTFTPLRFPSLPVIPAVAILFAAIAGIAAPRPPRLRPPVAIEPPRAAPAEPVVRSKVPA